MSTSVKRRRGSSIAIWTGIVLGLIGIAWLGVHALGTGNAPHYPPLTNDQKSAMEDALYQFKGHYVRIAACKAADCQRFARDLGDVFDAAGWEHLPDRVAATGARGIAILGARTDPALLAVVDQLNEVLKDPVIPPSRDDGGTMEIVIGAHPG